MKASDHINYYEFPSPAGGVRPFACDLNVAINIRIGEAATAPAYARGRAAWQVNWFFLNQTMR